MTDNTETKFEALKRQAVEVISSDFSDFRPFEYRLKRMPPICPFKIIDQISTKCVIAKDEDEDGD